MKPVIRNELGVITHLHYVGRVYLTKGSFELVMGTKITIDMVKKYSSSPELVICELLNNEVDSRELKLSILKANSYLILSTIR